MSELNEMSCEEFADAAAELALGVLTGRERAQAITHLDQCDTCREHVRQLSLTSEEMLGLLPSREPQAGFETRVMGRLGHPAVARRPKRTRRMLATAAVTLAAVAAGLGGWGLRGATSAPSPAAPAAASLRSATLLTASHETAGHIFLYNGSPRWLYMDVDTGMGVGNGTVICQLVASDGRIITVGSFNLDGGYGSWGSPDPLASGRRDRCPPHLPERHRPGHRQLHGPVAVAGGPAPAAAGTRVVSPVWEARPSRRSVSRRRSAGGSGPRSSRPSL